MLAKYEKLANRIQAVIDQSTQVAATCSISEYGSYNINNALLNEWLIKSRNIIKITFGENSTHYTELHKLIESNVIRREDVDSVQGLLIGALDDFKNGFIVGQEFLIAGEIFDSVLEESKHLLNTGHKDAAAILGRVVTEDSLKRLSRREGLNDNYKATRLNDELKKIGLYTQPQWRLIQVLLDLGNSAAHGNFNDYNDDEVNNMLHGIEMFFANYF